MSASPDFDHRRADFALGAEDERHVLDAGRALGVGGAVPHQSGFAVSLTYWPLTHSTNLYGPVPIGLSSTSSGFSLTASSR